MPNATSQYMALELIVTRIICAFLLFFALSVDVLAADNLKQCVTIKSSIERLGCYDAVSGFNANNGSPVSIVFSDKAGAVSIEILDILVGMDAVAKNKIHRHELVNATEQGKSVLYFEVKITNNKFDGTTNASYMNFQLDSTNGEIISPNQSRDYLRGKIHKGRTARGGFYFLLYEDSFPKTLVYKTGLSNRFGESLNANSPDLQVYIK